MHVFLICVPGSSCIPDVITSCGFECEVRTIWGHPQLFERIGVCVMNLAQESDVRVTFGVGSW